MQAQLAIMGACLVWVPSLGQRTAARAGPIKGAVRRVRLPTKGSINARLRQDTSPIAGRQCGRPAARTGCPLAECSPRRARWARCESRRRRWAAFDHSGSASRSTCRISYSPTGERRAPPSRGRPIRQPAGGGAMPAWALSPRPRWSNPSPPPASSSSMATRAWSRASSASWSTATAVTTTSWGG